MRSTVLACKEHMVHRRASAACLHGRCRSVTAGVLSEVHAMMRRDGYDAPYNNIMIR